MDGVRVKVLRKRMVVVEGGKGETLEVVPLR